MNQTPNIKHQTPGLTLPASLAVVAVSGPLTGLERSRLEVCEGKIKRGLESFLEVAEAFLEVRDGRLYRERYRTFEQYCEEAWGITPRRARQVVAGADVVKTLREGNQGSGPPLPLPTNERQTRALQALPREQQGTVWNAAVYRAQAQGREVTGADVEEVVRERKGATEGGIDNRQSPIAKGEKRAGGTDNCQSAIANRQSPISQEEKPAAANLSKFGVWRHKAGKVLHSLQELVDVVGTPANQVAAGPKHALRLLEEFRDFAIESELREAGRQRWNDAKEDDKRVGQGAQGIEEAPRKRRFSAAARARLSAAARARWATAKARGLR